MNRWATMPSPQLRRVGSADAVCDRPAGREVTEVELDQGGGRIVTAKRIK
ncbi:MAG: hypothetical protein SF097_09095 [Acidobacteriota bacterium]|nr:hypothetical protein [Acidobacteriota bacterium]